MNSLAYNPIIIIGCNHSGTRALVSILEKLGSFSGPIDNPWKEHQDFLQFHKTLMQVEFGGDFWYKNDLIDSYQDNLKYKIFAQEFAKLVDFKYPQIFNQYWHWKCPRSSYFLPTWCAVYPNALFIHIIRDGRDVAVSLCQSNEKSIIADIEYAFKLWNIHISKILSCLPAKNITIKYEELYASVNLIAQKLLIEDESKINEAQNLIKIKVYQKQFTHHLQSRWLKELGYLI